MSKIELGQLVYLKKENFELQRTIDVVFSTDNNYVKYCAVALTSILLNSDSSSFLRFWILDGGIKEKNKQKLSSLMHLRDFEINFVDMSKFDFSNFPMNRKHISLATYYRLVLPEILPEDVKKVIYLDCDIIVERDLKHLWEIELGENLVGAVEDEGSINQLRRMELPFENNYFNAGVLVLNIEELRKFDLKEKCFEYFNQNEEKIQFQDQDLLNAVLNGKCLFLPLGWNANARLYFPNTLKHKYTKIDEQEARQNPAIIHYTDRFKPWMACCTHPLKDEYWKFICYTPWKIDFYKKNLEQILRCIFCQEKSTYRSCIKIFNFPIFELIKDEKIKRKYFGFIEIEK